MISKNYDITATRSLILPKDDIPRTVYLQITGNAAVYIGGADVTSSNGVPYEKHSSPHTVFVPQGQTIYAVCAEGTTDSIRVMTPDLD